MKRVVCFILVLVLCTCHVNAVDGIKHTTLFINTSYLFYHIIELPLYLLQKM